VAASGIDATIQAFHAPKSRESEAVRGLRTAIYFKNSDARRTVLQVTSSNSGDGKTTLASNLAVSLAQSGKRVLLIDADLRPPRIAKMFGIESEEGLSTVIATDVEVADATQRTPVANLWLLPSGPIPPNPAELLAQPKFEQLVGMLREHYVYVILDTPPLLAVSDPLIVSRHVDGVILVVRLTNSRQAALRSRELLVQSKAEVMG
jgi:succinoglycan biosynthesis transport protein ExoP